MWSMHVLFSAAAAAERTSGRDCDRCRKSRFFGCQLPSGQRRRTVAMEASPRGTHDWSKQGADVQIPHYLRASGVAAEVVR